MAFAPALHPNEQGPRFIHGKTYYWGIKDGKKTLLPWLNDAEGNPAQYHLLPHLPEEIFQ
jgi:hypothetical protein